MKPLTEREEKKYNVYEVIISIHITSARNIFACKAEHLQEKIKKLSAGSVRKFSP